MRLLDFIELLCEFFFDGTGADSIPSRALRSLLLIPFCLLVLAIAATMFIGLLLAWLPMYVLTGKDVMKEVFHE